MRRKVFSFFLVLLFIPWLYCPSLSWAGDTTYVTIKGTDNISDAYINSSDPDMNYSPEVDLRVSSTCNAIISISGLAGFLPANAIINSCICNLYCTVNTTDGNISACQIFKPWDDEAVTWNSWDDRNIWGTAGCQCAGDDGVDNSQDNHCDEHDRDRKATAEATVNITTANTWYGFTISNALAQDWYNQTAGENGILLDYVSGSNAFASSEYTTDTTKIPFVTIGYSINAPPPPSACSLSTAGVDSFGYYAGTDTGSVDTTYTHCYRFQNACNQGNFWGIRTKWKCSSEGEGLFYLALYDDNGTSPYYPQNRLWKANYSKYINTDGWIDSPNFAEALLSPIDSGSWYWVCITTVPSANCMNRYYGFNAGLTDSTLHRWKAGVPDTFSDTLGNGGWTGENNSLQDIEVIYNTLGSEIGEQIQGETKDTIGMWRGALWGNTTANNAICICDTSYNRAGILKRIQMKWQCAGLTSSHFKLGFYSDTLWGAVDIKTAHKPRRKLWASNTGLTANDSLWFGMNTDTASILPTRIYWICYDESTVSGAKCKYVFYRGTDTTSQIRVYRSLTYQTAWPDTFNNSWSTNWMPQDIIAIDSVLGLAPGINPRRARILRSGQ